jgi:pantoate ligase/cytidylate kinase
LSLEEITARQPIIAIDGPAGAGKSTVTKQVAQKLGLLFLDTGAMYRAVTWAVLQAGIAPEEQSQVAALLPDLRLTLRPPTAPDQPTQVFVNDHEVTAAIRTAEVTGLVSVIAAQAAVRETLVAQQQLIGQQGGVVMEGRDIGTKVFPDAEVKIFLTATVAERARRRQADLAQQGQPVPDLAELEASIAQRDDMDSNRAVSPLCQAADAILLVTDGMTIPEVVDAIVELYHSQTNRRSAST